MGSDTLKELAKLCQRYVNMANDIVAAEDELKDQKDAFNRLRMETIPDMFFELEISELKLRSGEKIIITSDIQCGITNERKTKAHTWLMKNGFGGLIKMNVKIAFGKDEIKAANNLVAYLSRDYRDSVSLEKSVHPATLKSFIKEQMAEGNEVPHDLFGVFPFNVAKLERKK